MAAVGVAMVQISHGHYTVDVVIAYFITTRIFWTYHTLANNAILKVSIQNLVIIIRSSLTDSFKGVNYNVRNRKLNRKIFSLKRILH